MSAVSTQPELQDEPPVARIDASIRLIEQAMADLVGLAAVTCEAPFATLTIPGVHIAWSRLAGRIDAAAVPDHRACDELAVRGIGLFEVPNVALDERFKGRRTATASPAAAYYAGVPLVAADGQSLGLLAVIDPVPRQLKPYQSAALLALARQAATQFALCKELILARAIAASTPVAFYHSDVHGNITYANPEYRRVFGLRPEQSIDDWSMGVHPEDVVRMRSSWAEFCRRPRPMRFDYRTVPSGGAVRFLAEQVVAADGVGGFVGTISDFTDLVAARSDLVQSRTLVEAIIANLPVALLACDAAGLITRHNNTAAELFSIPGTARPDPETPERYLPAAQVYRADGVTPLSPAEHPLARALGGEVIRDLELVIVPQGATARTTLSNARRLAGPDGQTLGAVLIVQDVTERKLADLELERVHKQLLAASRQAGMAEIATNVLHNVGNVLNSVNVSASLLAERINNPKSSGVARVASLLKDHTADLGAFISSDERGRHLPAYLAQLADQLQTDKRVALEELASLRENIEHIKDTVNMQQSYAKLCGVTETVAVAALVEDGLRMNAGALARHGITLRREIAELPPITVDKHKVLQILVNLVRNAKYACDESGRADKTMLIRVEGDDERVRISVADNGIGIRAENMSRLFTHGFTTRASGHGFGLHSGALTARELGGALTASSDGPGCGATFTLELPRALRQP